MSRAIESLRSLRPPEDTGWLGALRSEAFRHFEDQGIPTRRLEDWKGTNLASLDAMDFGWVAVHPSRSASTSGPSAERASEGSFGGALEAGLRGPTLVFVDGRFDAVASRASGFPARLPRGVRALSLAEAIEREPELLEGRLAQLADPKRHPLVALQTAFLEDGAVLVIEAEAEILEPIRLRFVSTGDPAETSADTAADADAGAAAKDSTSQTRAGAAFPRLLLLAGAGSSATLSCEHVSVGTAPGLTAFVSEIHLAEGARLESVEIQAEEPRRIHFTSTHARLERNARYDSHVLTLGTGLVRSELSVHLAEPGAETNLCGLLLGREAGHVDHFTTVDHSAERCTSDEEYRGVFGDRSEGVFRGRVIVRPGAQKTDARQSNPNLLLSEHASIDTKPQLEIYADDIRASHGSTIGQLDADALFFLRARGLDPDRARLLLTSALANGIVDRISNESLRGDVAERVAGALAGFAGPSEDDGAGR